MSMKGASVVRVELQVQRELREKRKCLSRHGEDTEEIQGS